MNIGQTMPETIRLAEEAIRAAQPLAEGDSFRPAVHFRAPARWMNDICGALYHQGYYHIFYQHSPFTDLPSDWGSLISCWGHARSRDLTHWEHLPIAVAPSLQEGIYQCASGCATHDGQGAPVLFYGHTPLPREGVRVPRQQWAALPLDAELRHWRTVDIGLAPGQSGVPAGISPSWTDMYVFREGGRTFAIFKAAGGLVCEAQNAELTRWQAVGHIAGMEGECPNLCNVQGRWLLLRSTYPMTYQVGAFDPERIAFLMDGPSGVVDYAYGLEAPPDPADAVYYVESTGAWVRRHGAPPQHAHSRGFYATSVLHDAGGRTVLLAWVGAFRPQGWNCCMSLPRVLSLDANERLMQSPAPELAQLRSGEASLSETPVGADGVSVPGIRGRALEVKARLDLGHAAAVELRLRDPQSGQAAVTIAYDGRTLDANGTVIPEVLSAEPRTLELQLFFDRAVMELFINGGRQTVTRVAYPASPAPLHIEVSARGGTARILALHAWSLSDIWPATP